MITKIDKNKHYNDYMGVGSNIYKYRYKISIEEATSIAKKEDEVIVAFRPRNEYVLMWWCPQRGELRGLHSGWAKDTLLNLAELDKVMQLSIPSLGELGLINRESLEIIKNSEGAQRCNEDGWMRFFYDPEDIDCEGFRLYDLCKEKLLNTECLHIS